MTTYNIHPLALSPQHYLLARAGFVLAPLYSTAPANTILAPPAVFSIRGLGSVRAELVITTPPAKFNHKGIGKGVLEVVVKAPPGVFNHQAFAAIAYTIYVLAPPAKFYHQGLVEYVDSYKPPAFLTDFINMTNARRDKAISYDKQHAFDMGPVERGNIDEGLMARAWRLRVDGTSVYLAVADENNSWWDEEVVEFTLPHSPVWSMDLTFDQNGRPFACWEFEGGIWMYWYDPIIGEMNIKYVCEGRTPRARLDARARHQLPNSDIYLFYLNDADDRMEYRMQSDRYNTAYITNLVDVSNVYLEVLAMARNYRLYIWMSEYLPDNEGTHNPAYHLIWAHSAVYPYYFVEEIEIAPDVILNSSHLFEYHAAIMSADNAGISIDQLIEASIRNVIKEEEINKEEISTNIDELTSADKRVAIQSESISEDELTINIDEFINATIRLAILSEDMSPDELTIGVDEFLSATKVTV